LRPAESFISQPVRSLQTMMRVIAQTDSTLPSVVPDGIYGRDTIRAVSALQQKAGVPVTGVTDQDTWEAIVAYYELALTEVLAAEALELVLDPGQVIRRGESNPNLFVVQAVLKVLSDLYSSITPPSMNGILDLPTSDSLASFQQLSRIPMTGELDKQTWKRLARQYSLAVALLTPPPPKEDLAERYL